MYVNLQQKKINKTFM